LDADSASIPVKLTGVAVPEVGVPEVGDAEADVEPAAADGLDCVSVLSSFVQPLDVQQTIRTSANPIDAQGRRTDLLIGCHVQQ